MSRLAAGAPPAGGANDVPLFKVSLMPRPATAAAAAAAAAEFPVADDSAAVASDAGGFDDVSLAESRWRSSE